MSLPRLSKPGDRRISFVCCLQRPEFRVTSAGFVSFSVPGQVERSGRPSSNVFFLVVEALLTPPEDGSLALPRPLAASAHQPNTHTHTHPQTKPALVPTCCTLKLPTFLVCAPKPSGA